MNGFELRTSGWVVRPKNWWALIRLVTRLGVRENEQSFRYVRWHIAQKGHQMAWAAFLSGFLLLWIMLPIVLQRICRYLPAYLQAKNIKCDDFCIMKRDKKWHGIVLIISFQRLFGKYLTIATGGLCYN